MTLADIAATATAEERINKAKDNRSSHSLDYADSNRGGGEVIPPGLDKTILKIVTQDTLACCSGSTTIRRNCVRWTSQTKSDLPHNMAISLLD